MKNFPIVVAGVLPVFLLGALVVSELEPAHPFHVDPPEVVLVETVVPPAVPVVSGVLARDWLGPAGGALPSGLPSSVTYAGGGNEAERVLLL